MVPCLWPLSPSAAPPPSCLLPSQEIHLLLAVAIRSDNELLVMCGGLRREEHKKQWHPNQRVRRENKKGSRAWRTLMPPSPPQHHSLAPCSDRKQLTSSAPSAAGAVASSWGSGWVCAWQEHGAEAA